MNTLNLQIVIIINHIFIRLFILRNFLYMERETQFELLKKYIDEKIDSQAVAVEQSIFERNMVEETPLDIIISDELPHFPYVR